MVQRVSASDSPKRVYGGVSGEHRRAMRRSRLIDCAQSLFGTRGYANTSIEQLCAEANLSTRSFYEQASSKEELLHAVFDEITGRAAAAAVQAMEDADSSPLAERIRQGFRAYLDVSCATHKTARICYVEVIGVSQSMEDRRKEFRDKMIHMIIAETERAVRRGEAVARDYRYLAVLTIGALNALAQDLTDGGVTVPCSREEKLDKIVDELTRVITAAMTGP
ncbi:TetR/AcrR family transcriptional regulator [Nocardia sp. XZ_19_369]|uniref:TetR/AcrR family transcriptional regulator n=1 Tax=Nocardia sp. XZ_19_369 TaxID=2769487 RepID=UPI00188E956B|nr:TetR/AcrR family transcriptional regulator [Nocardia sp. XZ_19_369]